MNSQEHSKHATQVVDTPGSREVVVRDRSVTNVTKTFTFDKVFGASSKQVCCLSGDNVNEEKQYVTKAKN